MADPMQTDRPLGEMSDEERRRSIIKRAVLHEDARATYQAEVRRVNRATEREIDEALSRRERRSAPRETGAQDADG